MQLIIVTTIYLLSIFVPLTFTTINSELFEFPKFILLLAGTLIITAAWAIDLYKNQNFKSTFRELRSTISISILAVLVTQAFATAFSINPYTSFWGYYSRFHGGLLTTICYTIIYFSALKWMDTKSTQKLIKISIITAILIGLYAIAERLGIDKNFWVQDVQNRPFSTLGQPNWLAAYLIPNIFLILYLPQRARRFSPLQFLLFTLLFVALLFTKSRSGFIAFALSFATYWILLVRQFDFAFIKRELFQFSGIAILTALLLGTPFTSSLSSYFTQKNLANNAPLPQGTQLETGGTESGDIRKIVWTGALKLIAKHPVLGTGPETFAYTYYWTRPTAHNLTSEWDFLYNKAHNEYLNIATGAGLIGLLAYLYFHYAVFTTSLTLIPPSKKINQDLDNSLRAIYPILGASIVSFTVTNFFGFSVIPVYLITILLASLPSTIAKPPLPSTPHDLRSTIAILLLLIYPARLFLADVDYARGKAKNSADLLKQAVSIRPGLDLYHSQLGEIYATTGQKDLALHELAINKHLNPYHLNFYKSRAKIYLALNLNAEAVVELVNARRLAPTDPKLAYNLGLIYTRLDNASLAIQEFKDAMTLKPNYQEPYYALTLLYEQTKQIDKVIPLLTSAKSNLATYSAQLKEKIEKYSNN